MDLYESVKAACDKCGKAIAVLERELGFSRGTIATWRDHDPSARRLQAVADALETTVDALLKGGV